MLLHLYSLPLPLLPMVHLVRKVRANQLNAGKGGERSGEDECNEVNKVNQMKGSVRTFLSLTSHSFVRSLVHVHFIHFTTIKT